MCNGLVSTDASVKLSVADAVALETAKLAVTVPAGDSVTVSDTAADIAAITQSQADALKAAGYTSIAST